MRQVKTDTTYGAAEIELSIPKIWEWKLTEIEAQSQQTSKR